jgi:glycosyltransferase involved in cell wall biosynthesis
MKRKLLILYTELANYTVACLRELDAQKLDIHLVRWPINKEAPFQFVFPEGITVYERNNFTEAQLLELAEKISPDAILCCGWVDKAYVKICRKFSGKAVTILTMDNKWLGTFRQRAATVVARFMLKPVFRFIWVPGKPQKEFALKLGFRKENIRTGFYSADVPFFRKQYEENLLAKQQQFPHRIIYAGRYYSFKGVEELWDAFAQVKKEIPSDWELWCLGTGDLKPAEHPAIKHFGFVQPGEMSSFVSKCGVYVLPSRVEPWGVAVHEFAAAGFPLLLSRNVGAASEFLLDGINGFSFEANNGGELKDALRKIMQKPDAELFGMAKASAEMALTITPASWAKTLQEMIGLS